MIELASKADIEQISLDLLKQSKAIDVFPTPVDDIIQYSNLNVSNEINLSKVDDGFFTKTSATISKLMQKVRGYLDRREKIIYLDLSQSPGRKNFIKLHETGHEYLPWQKQILEFLDDDETLDPLTNEEFEAEANYFASITLFQHDRFKNQISSLPLSIESVKHLSKTFGASMHATFRTYVERSKKRCALLVLQNVSPKGCQALCEVRNYFQSTSFSKKFGDLTWESPLGYKWPFVQDYYFRKRFKKNGEISLLTTDGNVDFTYHFFNNTYNAFVFLFPKGEKIRSHTKFIITGE